jgi:PEP-CTERM motif
MFTQARRLAIATALIWIGGGARVEADVTLSTPAGLTPGESFRFVFVTDGTTDATSSDISYYNSFVNAQAGGATYNGLVVSWDAIASTSSVSAIENIGQQTITGVYLADGTEVTTSTTSSGLWSGRLLAPIDEDLSGSTTPNHTTWTGTRSNGENCSQPLGALYAYDGNTSSTTASWIQTTNVLPQGDYLPLYGISQVLVVPQIAVPEPSTLLLASTGLMAGMAFGWSRSRGAQRRQGPVVRPNATE